MHTLRVLRFGPFELDVRAGELRKRGIRLNLREQAFQILLMLLEHPGEVVLRADIRQRLWPDDTVVDFDQSINAAVKRLRDALGEAAGKPHYIETLPKRGYRFLGAVEPVAEPEPASNVAAPPPGPPPERLDEGTAAAVNAAVARADIELPAARVRPRIPQWLVAAPVVLTLAIGAVFYARRADRPPLPPTRQVPLTTFAELTTFPAFSPDGERVAFSWVGASPKEPQPFKIYLKNVRNGDPVPVTTGPADDRLPQWSPDGSQIAFQRTTKLGHELMVVPVGGGAERKIAEMGIGLAWSPDGKEIAYVAPYPPQGSGGIVVRSLETGKVRVLTDPKPYAEGLVAWSPDGRQLAFTRSLDSIGP